MGYTVGIIGSSTSVSPPQTYACAVGVIPGDAVYVSAANTVAKASAIGPSTLPAIGIVLSKPTTTTCKLITDGSIDGYTGLTPGATYYVSDTPGQISTTPGTNEQEVGVAYNTTTLIIEMQEIEKVTSVTIENEGTTILSSSDTIMNFKGTGVGVTPAGPNEVDITIGGTGASDFVSGVVPFAWNTPSPLTILNLQAGDLIDRVEIELDTAFNDPLATLLVGTVAVPNLVLDATDSVPSRAATYGNDNNFPVSVAEVLRLTLNPGASTAGAGRILFLIRR